MFFNNKFNTFFGLNLTLVYTFPMCMAWRFHFPIRKYDFNHNGNDARILHCLHCQCLKDQPAHYVQQKQNSTNEETLIMNASFSWTPHNLGLTVKTIEHNMFVFEHSHHLPTASNANDSGNSRIFLFGGTFTLLRLGVNRDLPSAKGPTSQ